MSVDGVLFDIDDTLVDTRGAFTRALARTARHYLPHLGPERDHEVVAMWRRDAGGHYAAYTRGEATYRGQRMTRANELHVEFGGPALDEAGYDAWDAIFEEAFSSSWQPLDDAEKAVRGLLDAGVAVGALSNAATAYQTGKLARAGFGDTVPMLVGVDTLGFGKPRPEVFLEACGRLGTEPSRTAYVGDELDVDAAAAVRAGLVGVWVDRPGARRHEITDEDVEAAVAAGVIVLGSLAELPGALGL